MKHAILSIPNALAVNADGWAQLAPFGDHAGIAWMDGHAKPAIQRIDAEAGRVMKDNLLGFVGRVMRFFNDVPLYHGHPDVPPLSSRYPDSGRKGSITDMEIRDDGIYVRIALSNEGRALVESTQGLGLSAYVDASTIGEEDGKMVARWTRLRSVGLTHTPNLPVQLINEHDPDMNPALISALTAAGVTIANDAAPEAVVAGVEAIRKQRDDALTLANDRATQLATTVTERNALKIQADEATASLANEKAARITEALDHAVESGRIAEADRATWQARLTANFANESQALHKLTPTWKVAANAGTGDRKAGQSTTVEVINSAIADIRKADPTLSFRDAYLRAAQEKPELFN